MEPCSSRSPRWACSGGDANADCGVANTAAFLELTEVVGVDPAEGTLPEGLRLTLIDGGPIPAVLAWGDGTGSQFIPLEEAP